MNKFPTPSLSVRSRTTGLVLLGLLIMHLLFAPIGVAHAHAQAVTTTQLQQEFAAKVAALEKQHGGRHDDCRTE